MDLSTARRWKRGATCLPKAAALLLSGDLGIFDPDWRNWKLQRGKLVSPEGWEVTPGDVLSFQLLRSQLAIYQAENRALRVQYNALQEQPVPEKRVARR